MNALDYCAQYHGGSYAAGSGLTLVTEAGGAESPTFLGRLIDPARFSPLLLALGEVVNARHHVPAAMLRRILMESDPVVTVGGGVVRFEGFSACCSAYARVDLLAEGLAVESARHGTTNVDFSAGLRSALQGLRFEPEAQLRVTPSALTLQTPSARVEERRIRLPLRWLRGFLGVASLSARLQPAGTFAAATARRMVMALPSAATFGAPTWMVPAGSSLRLSTQPAARAVRLSGPSRLRALGPALQHSRSLSVWFDPLDQASAWVIDSETCRLTLLLSADPWRGLSAEGDGLLGAAAPPKGFAEARAQLAWQAVLDSDALGGPAMIGALAAQGHLGFDLAAQRWFHRELPWRPDRLETLLPRLKSARETAATPGSVRFEPSRQIAWVAGSQGEHRVDLQSDPCTCTCTWHTRTGGSQGPCRHVLAAQLLADERETS
jgi:hypothetical protein